MIKLMSDGIEVPFSITSFPDGTSQVWKIDRNAFYAEGNNYILWLFESEAELIHVCQLAHLCYEDFECSIDLVCPFLPYGRQDKEVGNQATFALKTFKEILYNAGITRIETFDAHSKSDMIYESDDVLKKVKDFHRHVADMFVHDVICFPDKGAAERYKYSFSIDEFQHVFFDKVRDQSTGEIVGLKLVGNSDLSGKNILIVDDICDGGMTFIKVAEALKAFNPNQIDLAVSHGLFSKGKQVLHDAGIKDIFTTNSLIRNPEGYKVW